MLSVSPERKSMYHLKFINQKTGKETLLQTDKPTEYESLILAAEEAEHHEHVAEVYNLPYTHQVIDASTGQTAYSPKKR